MERKTMITPADVKTYEEILERLDSNDLDIISPWDNFVVRRGDETIGNCNSLEAVLIFLRGYKDALEGGTGDNLGGLS